MTTHRAFGLLMFAGLVTLAINPGSALAAGGSSSAAVGGVSEMVDLPSVASASDDFENPNTGTGHGGSAFGSPAGISVLARVTGEDNIAPRYSASASFSSMQDTTFNYQPDYMGGMDDWVEVGLTGALSGTITGSGNPYCFFGCTEDSPVGGGYARARISISGPTYTAPPDEGGVPVSGIHADTGSLGGFVTKGETISINQFVSTGYFWVPRGEAISFSASLSVEMASSKNPFGTQSGHHGTVTADFSDTFEFDPYAFFDIRTPGITANSPTLGIVNNQLPAAMVPEPTSLAICSAMLAVPLLRLRRRYRPTPVH